MVFVQAKTTAEKVNITLDKNCKKSSFDIKKTVLRVH